MAYVTPIYGGSAAQIDYRLGIGQRGCGSDAQFRYRADARERPLRWIGGGLPEFGIAGLAAGAELTPAQHDMARALMTGKHPVTGEQLVAPKLAVPAVNGAWDRPDGTRNEGTVLVACKRRARGVRVVLLGRAVLRLLPRARIVVIKRSGPRRFSDHLIFRWRRRTGMWALIVLTGHAVLAAVLAVWSARVCFRPETKPAVREVAYKVFRAAWTTGAVSGTASGVLKLYESGFL